MELDIVNKTIGEYDKGIVIEEINNLKSLDSFHVLVRKWHINKDTGFIQKWCDLKDGMIFLDYTKSLDKLIPIWKLLDIHDISMVYEEYDSLGWFVNMTTPTSKILSGLTHLTVEQASAIATARAIREL